MKRMFVRFLMRGETQAENFLKGCLQEPVCSPLIMRGISADNSLSVVTMLAAALQVP